LEPYLKEFITLNLCKSKEPWLNYRTNKIIKQNA
jgi:hypothetical protein